MFSKALRLMTPLLMLTGCASYNIEDFRALSVNERAKKVCYGSSANYQRGKQIQELAPLIEYQRNLLVTGYRVHRSCEEGDWGTKINCRDLPVAIDSTYERSVLDGLQSKLNRIKNADALLTQSCLSKANRLSAERALELYKQDREP